MRYFCLRRVKTRQTKRGLRLVFFVSLALTHNFGFSHRRCFFKVFFSLLTGNPEETTEGLNAAAGFLRNALFKRLHIHTVPTLHFVFDRTTERAADMNALISKAVASRSKNED